MNINCNKNLVTVCVKYFIFANDNIPTLDDNNNIQIWHLECSNKTQT